MNMTTLEKKFVNSVSHSRQVAVLMRSRLRWVPGLAAGMSYLDVGCGNGASAIALAQSLALRVTGVDADAAQVRLARAAAEDAGVDARFVRYDATALPFATGEFDLAATNKATHHIPDWPAAICEMARVVRPGGYLLFGDFCFPEWLARLGRWTLPQAGYPTAAGLERVAEQAGLAVIHWKASWGRAEAVWWKPGPPAE